MKGNDRENTGYFLLQLKKWPTGQVHYTARTMVYSKANDLQQPLAQELPRKGQ